MKIDPNLQSILNAQTDTVHNSKTSHAQGSIPEAGTTQIDGSSDTVQFSSQFSEVQQLTAKVQQLPDIRSERVAALKEQIQKGTYNPDPAEVANALLNHAVNQDGNS
jgi:negative regulator of flagellin synthesis FlgM